MGRFYLKNAAAWVMFLTAQICTAQSSHSLSAFDVQALRAFESLLSTARGKIIYSQIQNEWKVQNHFDLLKYFYEGTVSKTDAVLSRKFDPLTGKESRVREVKVSLKVNQPLENTVLDLAHELTHALAAPSWDPYDPKLTASSYIFAALEAPGGEVDAVISECQVALEKPDTFKKASKRCSEYLTSDSIERLKVIQDFYRVGGRYNELAESLGDEMLQLPHLSEKSARLHSSTGGAPYPVSLLREYREITESACANSTRRRILLTQATAHQAAENTGRRPASDSLAAVDQFLALRCNSRF